MLKANFRAGLFLFLVVIVSPTARGEATAYADGSFTESIDRKQENTAAITATASVSNSDAKFDSYSAMAYVEPTILRASASASFGQMGFGALSHASAYYTDHGDFVGTMPSNAFAYFRPTVEGTGKNGNAFYEASVSLPDGTFLSASKTFNFGGSTTPASDSFSLAVPLTPQVFAQGITFTLQLSVETSNMILPGESAAVDFSGTARLPAIFIGDANGQPIPGFSGLQFIGDSGYNYPTTSVPEPSVALLLFAALGAGLGRYSRKQLINSCRL